MSRGGFVQSTVVGFTRALSRALMSEEIARQRGLLQSLDPRVRVIGLFALVLAVTLSRRLVVVLVLFVVAVLIAVFSRVGIVTLAKRVWLVVLAFTGVIALPAVFITPGDPVASLAGGSLRITAQGLATATLLIARVETAVAEVYRLRYMDYLDKFSEGDLLRLLNYLNKVQQELRYTQNQKLKVEIALSHLIGLERSATISDVLAQISDGKQIASKSPSPVQEKNPQSTKKKPDPELVPVVNNIQKPIEQTSIPVIKNRKDIAASEEAAIPGILNFDLVVSKWQGFVKDIANEKSFMLGKFIHKIIPESLEGNQLYLSSTDSHIKDLLKTYGEYFSKKSQDYFGKKMIFNYKETKELKTENAIKSDKKTDNEVDINSSQKDADPFVSAIIKELGGEEIR